MNFFNNFSSDGPISAGNTYEITSIEYRTEGEQRDIDELERIFALERHKPNEWSTS